MVNIWTPHFSQQDLQILEESLMYEGVVKVAHLKLRIPLFEGGKSEVISRTVVCRAPAVGVLLYDPILDKVVLIEQMRIGVYLSQYSPWLLEIVAGMVDDGEEHSKTAFREAEEEAGLHIQKLLPICRYFVSPGISTEETTLYCGIVNAANHHTIFGLIEESENIKVHVFSFDEAYQLLKENKIRNASSIIALQWLALRRRGQG